MHVTHEGVVKSCNSYMKRYTNMVTLYLTTVTIHHFVSQAFWVKCLIVSIFVGWIHLFFACLSWNLSSKVECLFIRHFVSTLSLEKAILFFIITKVCLFIKTEVELDSTYSLVLSPDVLWMRSHSAVPTYCAMQISDNYLGARLTASKFFLCS